MKTLLIAVLVLFTACTTKPTPAPGPIVPVVCSIEQGIASAFAASIGSALNCTNLGAIQSDLLNVLGKANLCTQTPPPASEHKKGIVGSIVCPLAVDAALGLLTSKIPPTWDCSSQSAGALGAALSAACVGVVPF